MNKVLVLLEGQGRTVSASSWGLHTFNVIRLVSKEYVYVVHNASTPLSSDEEMIPLLPYWINLLRMNSVLPAHINIDVEFDRRDGDDLMTRDLVTQTLTH